MVNRATKRLMAKQQRAEQRAGGAAAGGDARASRSAAVDERAAFKRERKRTPPRQFLKEVRSELKKVAWPSRREVATYTLVVLVSVIFVTTIVFGIDYGLNRAVFELFSK